jgi:3-dehydroquinate synthase
MAKQTYIGENALDEFSKYLANVKYSSIHFLADSNTNRYCMPIIIERVMWLNDFNVIVVDAGERYKTLTYSEKIVKKLLDANADRNALLVNAGGGMISDLGGFTASVYKRGIDFINMPTSLMGMVDAAVGGKTGVNYSDVKNVIGTFTNPKALFFHTPFLRTLPDREKSSAYSEIIKHIILSDKNKWNEIKASPLNYFTDDHLPDLIKHSVKFKETIVGEDFKENGKRASLNFGHTIGHAVESHFMNSNYPLLHGEAIAAGLIAEIYMSHKLADCSIDLVNEMVHVILELFPGIKLNCKTPDLYKYLKADKKNSSDSIGFSLIAGPGKPAGMFFPFNDLIIESINYMVGVFSGSAHLSNDND